MLINCYDDPVSQQGKCSGEEPEDSRRIQEGAWALSTSWRDRQRPPQRKSPEQDIQTHFLSCGGTDVLRQINVSRTEDLLVQDCWSCELLQESYNSKHSKQQRKNDHPSPSFGHLALRSSAAPGPSWPRRWSDPPSAVRPWDGYSLLLRETASLRYLPVTAESYSGNPSGWKNVYQHTLRFRSLSLSLFFFFFFFLCLMGDEGRHRPPFRGRGPIVFKSPRLFSCSGSFSWGHLVDFPSNASDLRRSMRAPGPRPRSPRRSGGSRRRSHRARALRLFWADPGLRTVYITHTHIDQTCVHVSIRHVWINLHCNHVPTYVASRNVCL